MTLLCCSLLRAARLGTSSTSPSWVGSEYNTPLHPNTTTPTTPPSRNRMQMMMTSSQGWLKNTRRWLGLSMIALIRWCGKRREWVRWNFRRSVGVIGVAEFSSSYTSSPSTRRGNTLLCVPISTLSSFGTSWKERNNSAIPKNRKCG